MRTLINKAQLLIMQIKLYKYTPYISEFINRPALRLSQPEYLNDPFECNPNNVTKELVKDGSGFSGAEWIEFNARWKKGIVSLSESKDHPLMWAHYANNHKGGVIEFTLDLKTSPHNKLWSRSLFPNLVTFEHTFDRVRYRRSRVPDFSAFPWLSSTPTKHICDVLALTKSESWSYEQEYRFIIPTDKSNFVYAKVNSEYSVSLIKDIKRKFGSKVARELLDELVGKCKNFQFIENLYKDGNGYRVQKLKRRILLELNRIDASMPTFGETFSHPCLNIIQVEKEMELFYFLEVDPLSVSGIYLGSRMPISEKDKIRNDKLGLLNKFSNLNNNIVDAKICDNEYVVRF
ncbi:DUF2971 domain-containing protein [Photobacterium kishitanii]|uniref:DUF2971 domain-containing protein n=1 Tax=Photobacterium kishitanii TaxID=318456 RepID=UPI0007EFEF9B|nr:DUF2971 domain-containing protein [Photobacterium kishitanii]OBU27121.1 hypothetical protein AYY22_02395 [Photobacterium kishitanii]